MNEQFKMSDVFECKLPLKVNGYTVFQKENSYYSNVCESVNERVDYLVAIAIAVNEYDQHVELISKQAEQIKMLREAVGFASIALSECANELNCFIDMKNSDLESSVTYCTENQPDYFDAQTVHESMVVVNNLQKALSATEQKL